MQALPDGRNLMTQPAYLYKEASPPLITTCNIIVAEFLVPREYLARIPYPVGICLREVRNDVFIVHVPPSWKFDLFLVGAFWDSSKTFLDSLPNAHWICVRARAGKQPHCALVRALLDKLVAPNCELRPLVCDGAASGPSAKTNLIRKEVVFPDYQSNYSKVMAFLLLKNLIHTVVHVVLLS